MRYLMSSLLLGTALTATQAQANSAYVELQTNLGTIAVNLDYTHAPISSNNFIAYVTSGFYRNTLFHRAVKGFVVQGGGMDKTTLKFKTPGRPAIVNESNNGLSNLRGTLAMARTSDPNSATSQFFVNLVDNTFLDYSSAANPGYAVFGKVVKGMSIADKIGGMTTFYYGNTNTELPLTSDANLVFVERVYASTVAPTTQSTTRIALVGSGTVTSQPSGINCGSSCSLSVSIGQTVKLTATPATGWQFAGWRGDCVGPNRYLTLDTKKGNHNCTALFVQAPAVQ